MNSVTTSIRSASARSTSVIPRPVTCVEYGLTIRSARFTLPSMPRTALIVPVREATGYYDMGNGVPPHVTVLFPFVDGAHVDEGALRDLLTRFRVFDFVLDRLEHFESGVAWLRPNPAGPFTDLTAAVWERWPDHPPYEGEYDEVMAVVKRAVDAVAARAPRVSLVLKADIRAGASDQLHAKVAAVERRLSGGEAQPPG